MSKHKKTIFIIVAATFLVLVIVVVFRPRSINLTFDSLSELRHDYEVWVGDFPSVGKAQCSERSFMWNRSLVVRGETNPDQLHALFFTTTLMTYEVANIEPLRIYGDKGTLQSVQGVDRPMILTKTISGQSITISVDYSNWSYRMDITGKILKY